MEQAKQNDAATGAGERAEDDVLATSLGASLPGTGQVVASQVGASVWWLAETLIVVLGLALTVTRWGLLAGLVALVAVAVLGGATDLAMDLRWLRAERDAAAPGSTPARAGGEDR